MQSKVGVLEVLDFDDNGELSPYSLTSSLGGKKSSASSSSESEGGEGEGGEEGGEGEEGEDEGEKPSLREALLSRMAWKKERLRVKTLLPKTYAHPEDSDIGEAEAFPSSAQDVVPSVGKQGLPTLEFAVRFSFFIAFLIDTDIIVFVSIMIDPNFFIGKSIGERSAIERTSS